MNEQKLKNIIEGALLAAGQPLNMDALLGLFAEMECPERDSIRAALQSLTEDYKDRGVELKEVGSGFRLQVREELAPWIARLWVDRPSRYSRALLETLALVAYRQPITRGEIEDIRGVSVSSSIMKTLQERDWIKVVGHRDVPGKPAMYGSTRQFLDYFNLKSLDELPTLAELRDIDSINAELEFDLPPTTEVDADAEADIGTGTGSNDDAVAVESSAATTPSAASDESTPATDHEDAPDGGEEHGEPADTDQNRARTGG